MSMQVKQQPELELEQAKKTSQFLEVLKRLYDNKAAFIGLIILLVIVIIAIIGPYIAPYDYSVPDANAKFVSPCWEHPFGTDHMGRDVFSRVLVGARYSLLIGIGSALMGCILGMLVGAVSGFFGGVVDQVIMRICDIIKSVPGMILNIALSYVLGSGIFNTILALGIGGIAASARLMRNSVLKVRKMEYLDAASTTNCSSLRIILKHVIPNSYSPIVVQASMGVGVRIIDAAGLSFLGLGVQPPMAEWGAMLTAGRNYIFSAPYLCIVPGLCIMVVVLALNLLGDGLRDAMDPKLKR